MLPSSSTPVNTVSFSNYRTKVIDIISRPSTILSSPSREMIRLSDTPTSHMKTPVFSKLSSAALITSVLSPPASTTIHSPPTQTEQHSTVISTCQPPRPSATSGCLSNTCENGGTCVLPGNYCKCEKTFAWHDCSVYVGK